MSPEKAKKPKPSFCYWENGRRADKDIHEPILAGDHSIADRVGRDVAKDLGLTDAEIESLFRTGEVNGNDD